MSSVLFVAPLLAAHFAGMPTHTRELHAAGLAVRAVATEARGETSLQIEIRAHGVTQTLALDHCALAPERLLASIEIVDANFDGHADVTVLREFGAKWGALDVFLFDAHTRRFTNASPLARALSHLSNATFDTGRHTITTRDIGPANPSRITYDIDGHNALREIDACRFFNPIDARVGTLVRSRGGASTFKTVHLGPMDVDPCL